jgi:hypothetical protein
MPKFDLAQLSEAERLALAYLARREIETNRNLLAPQLEPLKTALAKLAPADAPPKQPVRTRSRRAEPYDKTLRDVREGIPAAIVFCPLGRAGSERVRGRRTRMVHFCGRHQRTMIGDAKSIGRHF